MADKICHPGTPPEVTDDHHRRAPLNAFVAGLSTVVLWLAPCHPSTARIGEKLDRVLKHYGHCLRTVKAGNGLVYKLFNKNGLNILVHFYGGKVDEISYGKDTDIFNDELKELMQANAPGGWVGTGWPSYNWHNGELRAHYSSSISRIENPRVGGRFRP